MILEWKFLIIYYFCMNNRINVSLPSYREIPDVGLYLDQAVKYINGILEPYSDLQVTGSMLSNYVKLKIVPKGSHKMYSRDQIVMFLFVALTKPVLSMDQIRMTFELLAKNRPVDWYQWFSDFLAGKTNDEEGAVCEEKVLLQKIVSGVLQKLELDQYFAQVKKQNEAVEEDKKGA